jgi:antitoxin component of MazEF toxin-antitoxin module
MIKGGVKRVVNLVATKDKHSSSLIITIPNGTAQRMSLKPGDRVCVTKDDGNLEEL